MEPTKLTSLEDCATPHSDRIRQAVLDAVIAASAEPGATEVTLRSGEITLALVSIAAMMMALPLKHGVKDTPRDIARDVHQAFRKRLVAAQALAAESLEYETKVLT